MLLIQLGHIKICEVPKQEFNTVSDLFLSLFHSEEEQFFLLWNKIPIAFNYQTQLRQNFDAILSLCWLLRKEESGNSKVDMENDALAISLVLSWKYNQLKIEANFRAKEDHFRSYAETLQQNGTIVLSRTSFLKEWNTLLRQVMLSIQASGCSIENGIERRKIELLKQTESTIAGYGKLYSHE